jgi:hypothetical protein
MQTSHVARVGLFTVDANNNRIDKCCHKTTINDLKNSSMESLVLPDNDNPNTLNYPTIQEYLTLEGNNGFVLRHIDQSFVITDNL